MTSAPVTIITGGTSGIGAATALALLDQGHRVVATGRNLERVDAFRQQVSAFGDSVRVVQSDAASWPDVEALVADTLSDFGRIDNVIANAGFSTRDDVATGDPTRWADMVLTNVLGPALLVRASLEAIKENKGHYIFIGSVAGFRNYPGNLYGATKWAVTGFTENVRQLVTGHGCRTTLIAPGVIDTAFWTDGVPPINIGPEAVADAILYAINQPASVDINTVIIRPQGQPT